MTANELRIGNWVNYLGLPVQMNLGLFTHKLDPIPLTPEILEKAGFKQGSPPEYYFKSGVEISLNDDGYLEGVGNIPLQYLHQLQNLYFALTGEELTIEL